MRQYDIILKNKLILLFYEKKGKKQMKINFAGINFTHRTRHAISRPNGADSDIIIITKKPSYLYFDTQKQNVPPNSVIIIKKHTPYTHEAQGTYYRDDWMHFVLTEEEQERFKFPYNTVIQLEDTSILSSYIENIYFETYISNHTNERKIELFFELFYIEMMDQITYSSHESKNMNIATNLRSLIYHNPHSRSTIEMYASHYGISASRLQHLYKKTFEISIIEDRILARIEKAKFLLKNTRKKVNEIAEELGYGSDIQFMRQFKQHTGVTALAYRNNHNSNHN